MRLYERYFLSCLVFMFVLSSYGFATFIILLYHPQPSKPQPQQVYKQVNIGHILHLPVGKIDRAKDRVEKVVETNQNFQNPTSSLEANFKARQERVQEKCQSVGELDSEGMSFLASNTQNSKAFHQTRRFLFVDELTQSLYCPISGASSTSWFHLFANLRRNESPIDHLLNSHFLKRELLKFISKSKFSLLRDYFSFLVVRQPLDRLVSLYNLMLSNPCDSPTLEIYAEYVSLNNRSRLDAYHPNGCPTRNLTFEVFLQFIADFPQSNSHYRPITKACSPCIWNYKAIIKLEDYPQALTWILNQPNFAHFSPSNSLPHLNQAEGQSRSAAYLFSTVSCKTVNRILETYVADYFFFEYKIPSYVKRCYS